ncbi:MAG: hypothetical protein ACFE8L_00115 [Candidatus Hodarchaeota archaeon]
MEEIENKIETKLEKNVLEKILDHKALIFIIAGILARILMLFYYYYSHIKFPSRTWGDVELNFNQSIYYPPLGTAMLDLFRFISFGFIEVFAFWAFLWDLGTTLMFYFVLKNFHIKNIFYAFGLFLVNPFYFLHNSFSLENCGYHITDAFFFFFLFMALIFYPRKENYARYLFYIFLGISMCVKYYTLPALGFFFLKYLFEKDWKELKRFMLCLVPILTVFLIVPILFIEPYLSDLLEWYSIGGGTPLYLRIIPIGLIALLFIIFRLRKSDGFEIVIISIIAMASFMVFSYRYLRWFQSIIFYGILVERDFFKFDLNLGIVKRTINVNNHILTFYLSFIGVFLSYLFILYVI